MTVHRNLAIRPNLRPTVMLHSLDENIRAKDKTLIVTGWCVGLKVGDILHLDMTTLKVLTIIEQRDHRGIFDKSAFYIPGTYKPKRNPDDPTERKQVKSAGEWRYKTTKDNKNSYFKAVVEHCKLPEDDEYYAVFNPPTPSVVATADVNK